MAQKKWRQVKVKVNGRMVKRWTDGSGNYRLAKPASSGAGVLSNALQSAHNALGGNRGPSAGWRAAREEQRNPRRRDGQLSPRPSKAQRIATSTPKATPKKEPLQTIPASNRPKDMQAGKVYGDAGQPPAPKLPPKPTPSRTPARSGAASTRSGADSSSDQDPVPMDANYKAWAKANPTLAKKVKKGQAGYNAINNKPDKPKQSAKSAVLAGISAAKKSDTQPAKPNKTKSALQIQAEKRKKKKSAAQRAGWPGNRNY